MRLTVGGGFLVVAAFGPLEVDQELWLLSSSSSSVSR
jgi:hypothetical protein